MLIRIQAAGDQPVYEQIADAVRTEIASSRVAAGETLPPAKEIARALDVNAHTVLHAYQLLRDEGIVDLRRGRGAVVTPMATAMQELHTEAANLARTAIRLGVSVQALAATLQHAYATVTETAEGVHE